MKTAIILAAGRGERLKPLTDTLPKALCRIGDIPLIEYHIINLAASGFTKVIINHAWLGYQIRQHLKDGSRWGLNIQYSPEPPRGLETGGGIFNALPLLGSEPFLTVNADIYTDFNFSSIHLPENSLAHLILITNPSHNSKGDFGLADNGLLLNDPGSFTYAGVSCFRPEIFQQRQPGRYSLTPLIRDLASRQKASAQLFNGVWVDAGKPERLQQAIKLARLTY